MTLIKVLFRLFVVFLSLAKMALYMAYGVFFYYYWVGKTIYEHTITFEIVLGVGMGVYFADLALDTICIKFKPEWLRKQDIEKYGSSIA
jgi:uncharacterized membrane protein (DUF485 family)